MNKLLQDGFLRNQWGWFHGVAGGILAWFLPIQIIFAIALIWEIWELFWDKYKHGGVEKIYGSRARFLRDSFGDITLAVVVAEIVRLYPVIQGLIK